MNAIGGLVLLGVIAVVLPVGWVAARWWERRH
jgi:hypothetical protein